MQPPQRRHSSPIGRMQPSTTPFVSSRMQRLRAIHLPTKDATTAATPFLSLQPPPSRPPTRSSVELSEPPSGGCNTEQGCHSSPTAPPARLVAGSNADHAGPLPELNKRSPAEKRSDLGPLGQDRAQIRPAPPQTTSALCSWASPRRPGTSAVVPRGPAAPAAPARRAAPDLARQQRLWHPVDPAPISRPKGRACVTAPNWHAGQRQPAPRPPAAAARISA